MTDILARRLLAQRLVGDHFYSAVEAVRWLGAVQSQDYRAAQWGLAQRTTAATEAELDRLFDEGAILRTHLMRPTWHFVMPEDIRWLLELTSPRLVAGLAGRYRNLELDQPTIARALDLFGEWLSGERSATRAELGASLREAGISPEGQRLPHLLIAAEARGLVVSGPRRGKEFTYMLLEERAPKMRPLDREEALAELTRRYFCSHGPAQIQDFAWWSGLTMAEIKTGLAVAGNALDHQVLEGKDYWFDAGASAAPKLPLTAHLLPNYDEFTVAYRDRSAIVPRGLPFDASSLAFYREATPEMGLLANLVTVDGQVRGDWRRTQTLKAVRVEVRLLGPLHRPAEAAVRSAVDRFGHFAQRPADLHFISPSAQR